MSGFVAGAVAVAAVGAGASMYSANQAEIAGREAQKRQEAMQREAMSEEERMFQDALALNEPYREAGYESLAGLQALSDPAQRSKMLRDYYGSNEYKAMEAQAEAATLRNQSAAGKLRGGSTYGALETIAPQLGQNYLTSQYNNLTGLANMGLGAASQGAAGYQQLGQNQAYALNQIGMGRAQQQVAGQTAQNQALQSGINSIGSAIGYGYGMG